MRSNGARSRLPAVLATVVLASLAVALVAGVGAAASPADAGAATVAEAPADAVASTAAQEDLEEGERAKVTDTRSEPHSAVVAVGRQRTPLPRAHMLEEMNQRGTGFLVSDRHVVTAAHVVIDETTHEQYPTDELRIAPGQNNGADHPSFPYGFAEVERVSVGVNPYEEGLAPAVSTFLKTLGIPHNLDTCIDCNDFAVLTLDRPVGEAAGTIDPRPGDMGINPDFSVTTAGYPADTADGTQWLSKGSADAPELTFDFVAFDLPVTDGNSGGPIMRTDERGVARYVATADFLAGSGMYALPIEQRHLDAIEEHASGDDPAPAAADLHVIEGDGALGSYEPILEPSDQVIAGGHGYLEPSVALFNGAPYDAGGAGQDVEVAFHATPADRPEPSEAELGPELCRAEVDEVDPYDSAVAACIATEFDDLGFDASEWDGFDYNVHAVVDPDDQIEEYTDARRAPTKVDSFGLESPADWTLDLSGVPQSSEPEAHFDVTAEVTNGESFRNETTVSVDGGEHADCGAADTGTLAGGETASVSVQCSTDDVDAEDTTLTVTAGDAVETRTVEIVDPDGSGTVTMSDVTVTHPVGTDGDPILGVPNEVPDAGTIDISVTLNNVGDTDVARKLVFEMVADPETDGDSSSTVECVGGEWQPTVQLDSKEQKTLSTSCRLPHGLTYSSEGREVSAIAGTYSDDSTVETSFLVLGPSQADFYLSPLSVVGQPRAGEPSEVKTAITNHGDPGTRRFTVTAGDEVLHDEDLYLDVLGSRDHLDVDDARDFEWTWTPAPGTRGDVEFTADANTGQERTQVVTVQPQPFTVDVDVPGNAEPGDDVSADVTVANEGGGDDAHEVALAVAGETVAERTVAVQAGAERTVPFDWTVPADAEERVTVTATTETDEATATLEFGPACTTVDGGTVCDVNGDGAYRDVNGDGIVSNSDVNEFFGVQHLEPYKRSEFDFDGDGAVGQSDVIALFDYVSA